MKIIALKYCTECGAKRRFVERLFAFDSELCDDCYLELIESVRDRRGREEDR